jgi:hypothetical protein
MICRETCSRSLFLFMSLMSSIACSGTEWLKEGHGVVQLGGYWSYQGQAQHINIDGLIGDTFTVTRHSGSNGLVGVGYFLDEKRYKLFNMTYGVDAFYLPKTAVNGLVVQEDLFTNLSYNYTMTHFPVYAMAKSIIETKYPHTALIIDAGIGPNFTKTDKFSEQSLDGITLPDHIFSGKSSTTFSATAGIALRLDQILGTAPFECGYRFFYLGNGQFNTLSNQVNNTLKTGSAYANAAVCSIII